MTSNYIKHKQIKWVKGQQKKKAILDKANEERQAERAKDIQKSQKHLDEIKARLRLNNTPAPQQGVLL